VVGAQALGLHEGWSLLAGSVPGASR
jgi:hypothetical protein